MDSFVDKLRSIKGQSTDKSISTLLKDEGLVSDGPIGKHFGYFGFDSSNSKKFSEFIQKIVYFTCKYRLSSPEEDFGVYYMHYKNDKLYLYIPEDIKDFGEVIEPADLFSKVGPNFRCNPQTILASVRNSLVDFERQEADGQFEGKKMTTLIDEIDQLKKQLN